MAEAKRRNDKEKGFIFRSHNLRLSILAYRPPVCVWIRNSCFLFLYTSIELPVSSARIQSVYFINGYFGKMMIENRERNEPLILRAYDVLMDILTLGTPDERVQAKSAAGSSKAHSDKSEIYNYSPYPYRWEDDDTKHARLLTGQIELSGEAIGKVRESFLLCHVLSIRDNLSRLAWPLYTTSSPTCRRVLPRIFACPCYTYCFIAAKQTIRSGFTFASSYL